MVDFKELEALLKEVVGGKRLSASKLTKLQEMCMKSLKHDTKLVSILYRTHKSLPVSQKVSSLYVFDSLARAAKHSANKHSYPIKEISSDKPGNAGTFLFKLEGILDGLIEDMIAADTPESKEKTRKVLEIWTKANTFPADVLSRLLQSVDKGVKGTVGETTSTTPPTTEAPSGQNEDTSALNNLPPAILALLGSAISGEGSNAQPAPSVPIPAPSVPPALATLDQAQLALLQQIAQQTQLNAALAPLTSTNIFPTQPLGGPLLPRSEHSYTTGPVYIPPQSNPQRRHPDERDDPRRPAYNRDRYDTVPAARPPRERYDRAYDDGYGDNRRFRRPGVPESQGGNRRAPLPRSRSRSPPTRTEQRINSPPIRTQPIPTFTSEPVASKTPMVASTSTSSIANIRPAPVLNQTPVVQAGIGLDSFDFSGFDMTSPASWMSLGVAFKTTYGRDGTQEELVSTYMSMQNGFIPPTNTTPNLATQNAWQGAYQQQQPAYMPSHRINTWETREQDEMKRGGRQAGHGSYDDGIGYAAQGGRWQHSDAVVLTGGDD